MVNLKKILFSVIFILFILGCGKYPKKEWNQLGAMQIIANKNKILFFVETLKVKSKGYRVYDVPNRIKECEKYTIILFEKNKNVESWEFKNPSEFSLNPNVSRLFCLDDTIYLFHEFHGSQIYEIHNKNFRKVKKKKLDKILKELALPEKYAPLQLDKRLDRITQENGWKYIFGTPDVLKHTISWGNDKIDISRKILKDGSIQLDLKSTNNPDMKYSKTILKNLKNIND